uniref:Fibronectin type III-like domain-containing protein n=1 Tax=Chromera velia CCMP2878 TaxID=1169474 RepID=A0A0G4GTQ1_9ALVE|eukprot:Cvel_23333.t1-p1 / transcript=Cvel_23333.t1 / gene=Cvel_23333 / organism=Chromera_velia_CCMP2878 / gene_product=Probable beta-D-xylosidase 2, putative / transcript_product=Probable beta-D-xylosidase 2, putative / location=Cvel_scaffold2391:11558-17441(-) / protein_length=981 / sequence_SO=supercontig / SO=protein_coding / is_pseudo=false
MFRFAVSVSSFILVARAEVSCSVNKSWGCFGSSDEGLAPLPVGPFPGVYDKDRCAAACFGIAKKLSGFRKSNGDCFCGDELTPNVRISEFDLSKCSDDASENLEVLVVDCKHDGVPNGHACTTEKSKKFAFCDRTKPIDERVEDLLKRLTLKQKIAAISPNPELGDTCTTHTTAFEDLDVPKTVWLSETNSNVAAACLGPKGCPTHFPGPMGMGASFNRTAWWQKGFVFGKEQRAYANQNWHRENTGDLLMLTGFGPNINIARDPRFGRSSEIPGEDPVLSGNLAAAMVRGMQLPDESGRPTLLAYLKHYTAYSKEEGRGGDTYDINDRDMFETFLQQYEIAYRKGKPTGVMCSYNGVNGTPVCANDFLLNKVMRQRWGFPHAHVTSDCGAVGNLMGPPAHAPTEAHAAAWALNNGTDLEMGSSFFLDWLEAAVERNLTTEAKIDAAFRRGYRPHFMAGRFDPVDPQGSSLFSVGRESIASEAHHHMAYEAALQSVVLLKNADGVLPLKKGSKITVIGPMGTAKQGLMSDYSTSTQCMRSFEREEGFHTAAAGRQGWGKTSRQLPRAGEVGNRCECMQNIFDVIAERNEGGITLYAQGVAVNETVAEEGEIGVERAKEMAKGSEVVVLVVGNVANGNPYQTEGEGWDRPNIELPGGQKELAERVIASGTPVVLVTVHGGIVALDGIGASADGQGAAAAVVAAFNPGGTRATSALGDLLFGLENRWGKLPVTWYPRKWVAAQDMSNYDMAKYPGRSYKYFNFEEAPVYSFGFGLSLTKFELSCQVEDSIRSIAVPGEGRETVATFVHLHSLGEVAEEVKERESMAVQVSRSRKLRGGTEHRMDDPNGGVFSVSCLLENKGERDGDEVLQIYHSIPDRSAIEMKSIPEVLPQKELVDFHRVHVRKGSAVRVRLPVFPRGFSLVNAEGERELPGGTHKIEISTGSLSQSFSVEVLVGEGEERVGPEALQVSEEEVEVMTEEVSL